MKSINRLFSFIYSLPTELCLIVISVYRFLSPVKNAVFGNYAQCRFSPTCSAYAQEAYLRFGFFKGSILAIKRILCCNPFFRGGYDPVPNKTGEL